MPVFPHIEPRGSSQRLYAGTSGLIFAASAAATIAWGLSMATMGGMPMAGGWTMSMAWMPMCGQSWLETAGSFLGMWVVMMVAMMMPSLMPMLERFHRRAVGVGLGRQTAIAGAGYFFVWSLLGMILFPVGASVAAAAMASPDLSRAVPIAGGMVVLMAGAGQFTTWKARQLDRCREAPEGKVGAPVDTGSAWRHGLQLGVQCCLSCAGPMAILIVLGVMDLRAMAVVTAAITAERLAPDSVPIARATGVAAVGAGLFLITQAVLGLA